MPGQCLQGLLISESREVRGHTLPEYCSHSHSTEGNSSSRSQDTKYCEKMLSVSAVNTSVGRWFTWSPSDLF